MSARRGLVLAALGLVLLALAAILNWRDDIVEAFLDPKIPYAVYKPPPGVAYGNRSAWAVWPSASEESQGVPVFFIAPTTFDGGRDWNGPIHDRGSLKVLRRVMLPNYAQPFAQAGPVFVPLYRQASLYTALSLFDDALEARAFAYGDIVAAFVAFRREIGDRPFILAGVEQGGSLAARLLSERIGSDPAVRSHLVAAYLIDTIVPAEDFGPGAPVPACAAPDQTGCVLSWQSVNGPDFLRPGRLLKRARVWDADGRLVSLGDRVPLCVNPLLGRTGDDFAPARLNLGAANATGLEWGLRPGFMARQVSARCQDGLLRVGEPRSPALRPHGGFVERLRAPPYNLFWADIEADAVRRSASLLRPQPASRTAPGAPGAPVPAG